jgi:hypothetical protein
MHWWISTSLWWIHQWVNFLVYFKDCLCSLILVNDSPVSRMTAWWWIHQGVSTPRSEYTGESQLPGSKCIGESQLPCDEYTSESTSWCTSNKHWNRFTKKLPSDKQFRSQDSPMYSSQGSFAYLMYFAQKQFQILKIFMELFVFITDSLAKNTPGSRLESLS